MSFSTCVGLAHRAVRSPRGRNHKPSVKRPPGGTSNGRLLACLRRPREVPRPLLAAVLPVLRIIKTTQAICRVERRFQKSSPAVQSINGGVLACVRYGSTHDVDDAPLPLGGLVQPPVGVGRLQDGRALHVVRVRPRRQPAGCFGLGALAAAAAVPAVAVPPSMATSSSSASVAGAPPAVRDMSVYMCCGGTQARQLGGAPQLGGVPVTALTCVRTARSTSQTGWLPLPLRAAAADCVLAEPARGSPTW